LIWLPGMVRAHYLQPRLFLFFIVCHKQSGVLIEREDWKPIDAHDLLEETICRTSNRLFVGLPLCRDKHFTKISREFSMTVVQSGLLINLFPAFLKPYELSILPTRTRLCEI
jgi:hypothetical protein